ncbi:MAG: hypothetical protein PHQ34_06995 [Methanothrix sp.]|nr:hypothetical protein [Methanothrix sp.]
MCSLEEKTNEDHPEMEQEAEDSISSFYKKQKKKYKKISRSLKLDWIGGLEDMADQYSSVQLQHKILENWDEEQD